MRIDDKMLHIPPYVSVHWSRISALYVKGNFLVITLLDGDTLQIPDLPPEILEKIFTSHATFLEQAPPLKTSPSLELLKHIAVPRHPIDSLGFLDSNGLDSPPMRIAFGAFDETGGAMQHNPEQANAPDLPPDVLNKVSAIAHIVSPEEAQSMPQPEPHCNCLHCQFARAIQKGVQINKPEHERVEVVEAEEITEEDLQFQQWDISQEGDNLFTVTNRLDKIEQYNVYLGQPVGCTCGKNACEHIVAVLKS